MRGEVASRGPRRVEPVESLAGRPPAKAASAAPATTVVPDRFLRRWDPITVFFARDVGPARRGPEDQPERVVALGPSQPGAFRWLDARTLQFRPAEPWPSLTRFRVHGRRPDDDVLATLMAAPLRDAPGRQGAEGLEPVEEIALTFAAPLDPAALARMVSLELRPLPGIERRQRPRARPATTTRSRSWSARAAPTARATCSCSVQPIPLGTRAIVHLRLALDDRQGDSFREIVFSTAEPFRVVRLGCRGSSYPVTPEGTRYTREQAIACAADPSDGGRRVLADPEGAQPGGGAQPGAPQPGGAEPRASRPQGADARDHAATSRGSTLYSVALAPTPLQDERGRPLDLRTRSEVFLHFPRRVRRSCGSRRAAASSSASARRRSRSRAAARSASTCASTRRRLSTARSGPSRTGR